MIQITNEKIGKMNFTRTYSDEGFFIRQDGTGEIYDEAWDPVGTGRTYTETDEKIPRDEFADMEMIGDE